MPNPVNPAVEQITEAEQDMPEMDGTDQRHVQQSVVGHRLGQLLHTAAVVFADTDGDAHQQVVVNQPVVDPNLHARRFVAEERTDHAPRIEPLVAVSFLLEMGVFLDYHRIEPHTGHISHITVLTVVSLFVRNDSDIL